MPKLPEVHEIKRSARDPYRYDFKQASQILEALDFLRRESVKTGIPGIIELRDGASLILNGCFVGDEFMSTFEGRQVSYALTAESHRVICKMVDDVYAIFQSVCDD